MAENASQSLAVLMSAASILSGSESKKVQSPDITTLLRSRLSRVYELLEQYDSTDITETDLNQLQYITAEESLHLLEKIQCLLDPAESTSPAPETSPPPLGTHDLSHVRTLLSIIYKWAVVPLVTELERTRPGLRVPVYESRIIDLTERQLDCDKLPNITLRLLSLTFGSGISGKIRQTWITTSILGRHAVDMLTPCLILGWSPTPVSDVFDRGAKDIKTLSIRFLNVLRSHEAISALGTILSSISTRLASFPYVSKACAHLLSHQLRRPDGVRGLCTAVFGEDIEESDTAPLEKLEHIAKVLSTVPASANPQEYYLFMIPRILALLLPSSAQQTPPLHKRAAAFALSRMLSATFRHHRITSTILLPLLHAPFLSPSPIIDVNLPKASNQSSLHLTAIESLQTLQAFLLHTDPSPTDLSTILTPIAPELYTLVSLCHSSKTIDPNVRESLIALLNTWGRIVSSSDAIDGVWKIALGSGGDWEVGLDGFKRSTTPKSQPSISLLTAAEIEASSKESVDIDANPFRLRPDPLEFATFLKTLDRKDVSSNIFVKLLNEYRELKASDEEPMRTLLYLQLILQMQAQLSATILSKPEHVLSFIRHALDSESRPASSLTKKGLGLKDLRIVKEDVSDAGDSDDEDESEGADVLAELGNGREDMVVTAITLLLSVLEGNPGLSPHNAPDLTDILTSLGSFTSHASPDIRQLAREARLVLTARTASTSSFTSSSTARSTTEIETAQETYQKALKLLQDPIIPVRAHGLQLLRELVSRPSLTGAIPPQTRLGKPRLDPALVPGILSIFLQSIQDDESYIFLNAVQGLAAMVDGYGKDVLRGVVDIFISGTGVGGSGGGVGTTMSREELEARIRVGEALNAIVKRCGGALGSYVDILIPPLLNVLRSSHLPTTLRTSALSILAQCVATNAAALSVYTTSLADTCVELIQLESVTAKGNSVNAKERGPSTSRTAASDDDGKGNEGDGDDGGWAKHSVRQPDPTDRDPTTKDTKVATLRRAALHFLSQLVRSHIEKLYDSRPSSASASLPKVTLTFGVTQMQGVEAVIPDLVLKRARVVLRYVAATDEDSVSRVMAREALELVDQYREASLGF